MKLLSIKLLLFYVALGLRAQTIYNFNLENTDNQTVFYNDLKGGKLTVIDFWATWCKPCLNAMPKLNMLADTFGNKGVQFVGISVDGPRNWSKVKPFIQSMGIGYPVLIDKDGELMRDLNINAIPTLLIADGKNEIVYLHEGFNLGDEKIIRSELNKLLQTNKQ